MSSEQRLHSSNKYFKDQNGVHRDISNSSNSDYVYLNRGTVMVKANKIETGVSWDIDTSTLPRENSSIKWTYSNQQNTEKRNTKFKNVNALGYVFPFQYYRNSTILSSKNDNNTMKFDRYTNKFTQVENNSHQPKPPSNFITQLSPFHQDLIGIFGKLFCLREYNINCFEPSNSQINFPSSSALAENGNPNWSFLSSSPDRILESYSSRRNLNNSHPICFNKANQDYFGPHRDPKKNQNHNEGPKKL